MTFRQCATVSAYLPLYRYMYDYIDTSTIILIHLPLYQCICHYFDLLLTVHLSIIHEINQLNAQNLVL